jgi:hypothetical protein
MPVCISLGIIYLPPPLILCGRISSRAPRRRHARYVKDKQIRTFPCGNGGALPPASNSSCNASELEVGSGHVDHAQCAQCAPSPQRRSLSLISRPGGARSVGRARRRVANAARSHGATTATHRCTTDRTTRRLWRLWLTRRHRAGSRSSASCHIIEVTTPRARHRGILLVVIAPSRHQRCSTSSRPACASACARATTSSQGPST